MTPEPFLVWGSGSKTLPEILPRASPTAADVQTAGNAKEVAMERYCTPLL